MVQACLVPAVVTAAASRDGAKLVEPSRLRAKPVTADVVEMRDIGGVDLLGPERHASLVSDASAFKACNPTAASDSDGITSCFISQNDELMNYWINLLFDVRSGCALLGGKRKQVN